MNIYLVKQQPYRQSWTFFDLNRVVLVGSLSIAVTHLYPANPEAPEGQDQVAPGVFWRACSGARPSSFANELCIDPAYGISTAPGAEPKAHVCGECSGRLRGVTGQDGRIW